jgi:peptidoglycan hydrolase-like protein with peptidoglycan-binding domain
MKKYILSAVFSLALLALPGSTQAASLTSAQIQAILGLLSSFGADSSVIANVQTSLTGGTPSSGGSGSSMPVNRENPRPFCHTFSKDLTVGNSGDDVVALNQVLSPSGTDATSNSQFFNKNNVGAVVAFQAKYGIRQTGYVGPLTRAKLNALYACRNNGNEDFAVNPNNTYNPPKPKPIVCTMEARMCQDGSLMPRDANCTWRADKCAKLSQTTAPVIPTTTTSVQNPSILSFNPSSGLIGTTVVITGTGFTATGNKIKFGNLGVEANPNYSVSSTDSKTITFTVPTTNYMSCWDAPKLRCMTPAMLVGAGTYMVSVINANGTSSELPFNVVAAASY